MNIASLFTGAGGLDLGFERASFHVVWANEYDSTIWETFEHNFPKTKLEKRSIVVVPTSEIQNVDGIIGIYDLRLAKPALDKNKTNGDELKIPNHEYMNGGFSSIYMSRNRVRSWDEPSFTIQVGGRHAPIHPQAPKMKFIGQNERIFIPGKENLYRRLSVRECARNSNIS